MSLDKLHVQFVLGSANTIGGARSLYQEGFFTFQPDAPDPDRDLRWRQTERIADQDYDWFYVYRSKSI
jgi:hypothetical protein